MQQILFEQLEKISDDMLNVTNQGCVLRQALDVVEMTEIMQNFENSFRLLLSKQGVDALIDGSVDEMRDAGVRVYTFYFSFGCRAICEAGF